MPLTDEEIRRRLLQQQLMSQEPEETPLDEQPNQVQAPQSPSLLPQLQRKFTNPELGQADMQNSQENERFKRLRALQGL